MNCTTAFNAGDALKLLTDDNVPIHGSHVKFKGKTPLPGPYKLRIERPSKEISVHDGGSWKMSNFQKIASVPGVEVRYDRLVHDETVKRRVFLLKKSTSTPKGFVDVVVVYGGSGGPVVREHVHGNHGSSRDYLPRPYYPAHKETQRHLAKLAHSFGGRAVRAMYPHAVRDARHLADRVRAARKAGGARIVEKSRRNDQSAIVTGMMRQSKSKKATTSSTETPDFAAKVPGMLQLSTILRL